MKLLNLIKGTFMVIGYMIVISILRIFDKEEFN